jgi:hypothetical protein
MILNDIMHRLKGASAPVSVELRCNHAQRLPHSQHGPRSSTMSNGGCNEVTWKTKHNHTHPHTSHMSKASGRRFDGIVTQFTLPVAETAVENFNLQPETHKQRFRPNVQVHQLLFKWFGDRPNISRHMYALDNTISSSWCVHFFVGRCCKKSTMSWNSSFWRSSDHVSRKLAHTYTRKSAKQSPSARYVSHSRQTR